MSKMDFFSDAIFSKAQQDRHLFYMPFFRQKCMLPI